MKKLKTTWTVTLLAFAMVCSVWTEYRFFGVIGLSEIILLFIGFFGKYSDSEDLGDYHKAQDDYVKVIRDYNVNQEIKRLKEMINKEIDPVEKAKILEKIRLVKMESE